MGRTRAKTAAPNNFLVLSNLENLDFLPYFSSFSLSSCFVHDDTGVSSPRLALPPLACLMVIMYCVVSSTLWWPLVESHGYEALRSGWRFSSSGGALELCSLLKAGFCLRSRDGDEPPKWWFIVVGGSSRLTNYESPTCEPTTQQIGSSISSWGFFMACDCPFKKKPLVLQSPLPLQRLPAPPYLNHCHHQCLSLLPSLQRWPQVSP